MAQADSAYHAHNLRRVLDHAFQLAEQAGREQDAHRREALIGECMQGLAACPATQVDHKTSKRFPAYLTRQIIESGGACAHCLHATTLKAARGYSSMQIDWSFLDAVNWAEVAWLSALAFLATLIGEMVRHWFWAAVLAAVLFAAGYVFLAYFSSRTAS